MAGSYNAGSIEATLTLDRSEFNRELRQAKKDAEEFEKKTYSAKVSLNTGEATAKIQALQDDLKSLGDVALSISLHGYDDALTRLRDLQTQVDALDGRTINIRTDVDTVAAGAALTWLDDSINAIDGRQIRVDTDVDTAAAMTQLAALQAQIALINGSRVSVNSGGGGGPGGGGGLGGLGAGAMSAASGIGMLGAAILAVAPLIPPLVTATAGAAAALLSFGVAAGGALGIFGAATMGAVQQSQAHSKAIKDTEQKLKTAQEQLARTEAGTDAYKEALKKVTAAEKAHADALKAQTKEEKGFTDSLEGVKGAWKEFITTTEQYTLKPLTTVVEGATAALPKLTPVVEALAPTFQKVADSIKGWLSGDGVKGFVDFLKTTGVPVLHNTLAAMARFGKAGGALIKAFGPVAVDMSKWLRELGDRTSKWAENGGAERFKDKFIEAWHQLEPTFKALSDGLGELWDILSGVSESHSLALVDVLRGITDTLKAVKPGTIAILNTAFMTLHQVLGPLVPVLAQAGKSLSDLMVAANGPLSDFLGKIGQISQVLSPAISKILVETLAAIKDNLGNIAPVLSAAGTGMLLLAKALAFVANALPPGTIKYIVGFLVALPMLPLLAIGALLKLKGVFLAIGDAAVWLWQRAIKPAWNGIATGATWLWTTVIKPVFHFIAGAFTMAGKILWTIWSTYFKVVFLLIGAAAKALWVYAIKPVVGWIRDGWHWVGDTISSIWRTRIKPVWDAIAGAARILWKVHLGPTFSGIASFFGTKWTWIKKNIFSPMGTLFTQTVPGWGNTMKTQLIKAFDFAWKGIKDVWENVKKAIGSPIYLVAKYVWNEAIYGIMDKIAGFVGQKNPLGQIPTDKIPHFAAGGPVPMTPGARRGRDSVQAMLMPDEHVLTTADVAAMGGHQAVMRFRSALHNGKSVQGANNSGFFEDGGFLGSLGDIASSVKDTITKGVDALEDTVLGAVGAVANPLLDKSKALVDDFIPQSNGWNRLANGAMKKPIDWIKEFVNKEDKKMQFSARSVGGSIPTGSRLAIINAALKAAGVPPPGTLGQWQAGLNTLITRESGWNASAINNWDSNAKAGHPSQGLAQTIPSTFNAYVPASLRSRGILDPIANVAAAIRYIVATYGSITGVQQANAGKTPRGYWTGTDGAAPGLAWVGEKGPELINFHGGETVYNNADSMRMAAGLGNVPGYASGTAKQRSKVRAAYKERDKDVDRRDDWLRKYNAAKAQYAAADTVAEQRLAKKRMAAYDKQVDKYNKEISNDNKLIQLNRKRYKSASAYVEQERKDAAALAAARKKTVASQLSQAQSIITRLKDSINAQIATAMDARNGYRDQAVQMGQLSSLTGNRASGFAQQIQQKIKDIQNFQKNLHTLSTLGLSKTLIQQIAAMGPEQGGALAQSLARTTTALDAKNLNSQYAQLEAASETYADSAADDGFGLSTLKAKAAVLGSAKITVTAPNVIQVSIDGKTFTAHTEKVVEKKVFEIVANAGKKK